MHCCRWTSKPSPRGEDLPRGPAIPVGRPVRPLREEPPKGPPLLNSHRSPDSLLPHRPPPVLPSQTRQSTSSWAHLQMRKGRVSRGLDGAAQRRDGAQSPRPAADLDDASRPRPRPGRMARPPAQRTAAAERPEAAHPDGPPGTSSALRLARRRYDGGRQTVVVTGLFVNFVHPSSVARRRLVATCACACAVAVPSVRCLVPDTHTLLILSN